MNVKEEHSKNTDKKVDLQIQLVHELRRNKRRLNLLFIGTAGVGKSSVINSIATAVTNERFREYAISGTSSFEGGQTTCRLHIVKGEKYGRFNREIFGRTHLPNLIDIAGFQDEDTAFNEELIRVVLYGRFESGESFIAAQRFLRQHGVAEFRKRYRNVSVDEHKIDRVIVVASAEEPIPRALIKCVKKAAGNTDGRTGNRAIPVFGIMTKTDQVDVHTVEFRQHETSFQDALQMTGSSQRYKRVACYCDETDPSVRRLSQCIETLDIPFLEFMKEVCSPSYEVLRDEETFTDVAVPWTETQVWKAIAIVLFVVILMVLMLNGNRR